MYIYTYIHIYIYTKKSVGDFGPSSALKRWKCPKTVPGRSSVAAPGPSGVPNRRSRANLTSKGP